MSLLDLYAEERDRATAREWANPLPLPEPSFNIAKTLGAGKAVAGAAMESLGSFFDLAATEGPGSDMRRPGGLADQPEEVARRAQAKAALMQAGRAMRAKAEDWMPDPQTAHWSQQAVAGLTRFGAKAVFDVGLFGPVVGASVLGLDEANTTAQRLMEKGIDANTAWQVGGVTGVLSAGGAVMPMAGGTLAKTAALVALGGPVQYMAQEGLSKKILQNANYEKEAALHDPFDPLGFGISTAAAALFGAAGMARMRSVRRLESVRAEQQAQASAHLEKVVEHIESGGRRFADDGSLLTSPKGAQGEMQVMPETAANPGFGITPAKDKSPEELARVGREYLAAMKTRYGDTDQALAAYNAGPGTVDAAIKAHGEDWLAHMPEETQKYVAKARKLIDDHVAMVAAKSPEVTDAARVAVLDDAVARSLPDAPNAHAEMVRAADAIGAGEKAHVTPIFDGPQPDQVRAVLDSVAERLGISRYEPAIWGEGLPAPEGVSLQLMHDYSKPSFDYESKTVTLPKATPEEYIALFGSTREDILAHELGHAMASAFGVTGSFAGPTMRALRAEMRAMSREFRPEVWDKYKKHAGKDQEMLADSLATWLTRPESREKMPLLTEFLGDRLRPFEPITESLRARSSNTLPQADEVSVRPERASAIATPEKSTEAVTVEAMAKATPDMQVRLPGTEKTVSLADALEQIRAEAKDEAGFADLVQVAAQCALTGGLTGAA